MWKYLKNVQPPKRKQTSKEQKAHDKEYESKHHKRLFQAEWKNNRPWHRVERNNDDVELVFCDFCIKAGIQSDRNVFLKGSSNLKLYSINQHETSNIHLYAVNKYVNEKKPTYAPAFKAKLSLDKAVYKKTVHHVQNCACN